MALKKSKVEIKVVIVLLLLSFVAGYIWQVIKGNEGGARLRSRDARYRPSAR